MRLNVCSPASTMVSPGSSLLGSRARRVVGILVASAVVGTVLVIAGCSALAQSSFAWPLPGGAFRPTPLHFGLYVTPDPAHNPISPPERFIGYHVGTDFEIYPDEERVDVPVYAICSGEIVYSSFAEGYGGLIAEHCLLRDEKVTVLYGHLLLSSLPKVGDRVTQSQTIALLAPAHTHDSDGNRKHLHLGIHRGWDMTFLGYVQTEAELSQFIDPQTVLER